MSDKQIFSAIGRRKTSVAQVNLRPGNGKCTVNGRPFEEYFVTEGQRAQAMQSLNTVDSLKKYDVQIRAEGGGLCGQAGATRMAIARALTQIDIELRPTLKQAGHLRRDSRMKERKKSGQPGARKRFQFSKR